ncbi:thymidylate kinase, partial [bacterium AH-315-J19]|nr:thymidylate kinase [bacterium AH-315-J19]
DLSRFDTEDLEFHKVLRAAFLDIAKRDQGRFGIVDATLSRDAIETQIKHILMQKFSGLRLG